MKIYTETIYEEFAEMLDYLKSNDIKHLQSFIEHKDYNFELWEFTTRDDFDAFVEKFSTHCITPEDVLVRFLVGK